MRLSVLVPVLSAFKLADAGPPEVSACGGITYVGTEHNGVELFQGIPYAHDTSGENRFKPPRPYTPAPGTTVVATKPGPACPQPLGVLFPPLGLGNITEVSEDCLSLNVARPKLDGKYGKMPVMVWIHGKIYVTSFVVELG